MRCYAYNVILNRPRDRQVITINTNTIKYFFKNQYVNNGHTDFPVMIIGLIGHFRKDMR